MTTKVLLASLKRNNKSISFCNNPNQCNPVVIVHRVNTKHDPIASCLIQGIISIAVPLQKVCWMVGQVLNIPNPLHQEFQFSKNGRLLTENIFRFLHTHFQYLCNISSAKPDFQSFTIITITLTTFTWYIYIRKKLHIQLHHPISLTSLTSATPQIETKSTGSVTRIRLKEH